MVNLMSSQLAITNMADLPTHLLSIVTLSSLIMQNSYAIISPEEYGPFSPRMDFHTQRSDYPQDIKQDPEFENLYQHGYDRRGEHKHRSDIRPHFYDYNTALIQPHHPYTAHFNPGDKYPNKLLPYHKELANERADKHHYHKEPLHYERTKSFFPQPDLPHPEPGMDKFEKSAPFIKNDNYHSETKQCYQCAWSPAKTDYITLKRQRVAVASRGGWDKCKGPFTPSQAKHYGVDLWQCHDNCYLRVDRNGNFFRGCYKGEFDVDPKKLGCHYQADSLYCFCDGDRCNNGPLPENNL